MNHSIWSGRMEHPWRLDIEEHIIDVRTYEDKGPRWITGSIDFRLTMHTYADVVAALTAIEPTWTEDDVRSRILEGADRLRDALK
jgi:hypothetical protein